MASAGRRRATALLLALSALAACGADRESEDRGNSPVVTDTLVDAEGRNVLLLEHPRRVVSLVPSATRALHALGAAEVLVGRTDFDTASALADLPSVGGGLQPSIEVLLSLEPDLVIRFAGESDRETPARLDRAGIPHLAVRPERIGEVREMIATLGRVTGRGAAADSILALQTRVLDSIRSRAAGLEEIPVAFTLGGDPPWVAGSDTFVGELLVLAGGRNVFADLGRPWAGVSPETILARDPRVLVVPDGVRVDPRLSRGREVRSVPPVVQLPGHDLHLAALAVARALRPGLLEAS